MSEITRFFSWDGNGFMHEDADGDYVLYEDHKAEVERLKALIVSQHNVMQWAHEREAIEAIVQEAQEREQREAAATGGTR